MALSCLWLGCAEGYGLPGLALHATSVSRQQRSAEGVARSWDVILWADVSFRVGSITQTAAEHSEPWAGTSDHALPPDANSCSDPALCAWERAAAARAFDDLGETP